MLVTEVWIINPWPVRRRANRANNRAQKVGAAAIRTQEAIRPRQTQRAKIFEPRLVDHPAYPYQAHGARYGGDGVGEAEIAV